MNGHPDVLDLIRQWIEKAEHDLINAHHTMTLREGCPYDTVCFHAQQCAEKYVKAILIFRQVEFPRTHDLSELTRLVDVAFADSIAVECQLLNVFSVSARYPGFDDPLGVEEAMNALAAACRIREMARARLPDDVLG